MIKVIVKQKILKSIGVIIIYTLIKKIARS